MALHYLGEQDIFLTFGLHRKILLIEHLGLQHALGMWSTKFLELQKGKSQKFVLNIIGAMFTWDFLAITTLRYTKALGTQLISGLGHSQVSETLFGACYSPFYRSVA